MLNHQESGPHLGAHQGLLDLALGFLKGIFSLGGFYSRRSIGTKLMCNSIISAFKVPRIEFFRGCKGALCFGGTYASSRVVSADGPLISDLNSSLLVEPYRQRFA